MVILFCWNLNPKFQSWQVVALGGLESGGTDERASEGGFDLRSDNLKLLKRKRKPPGTLGRRRSRVRVEEPLLCDLSKVNECSWQYNIKTTVATVAMIATIAPESPHSHSNNYHDSQDNQDSIDSHDSHDS